MASAWSASLNGGLGAQQGPGAEPLVGIRGAKPPEAESFLYIFTQKKWRKVKDLSENLPPCLSCAAMASPKFWSMGGALTAHSWIRH